LLLNPMVVSVGIECSKIKESKALEADMPEWGSEVKRASYMELSTALSLLYAGADLLIMYHPDAVAATKKAITDLMDKGGAK